MKINGAMLFHHISNYFDVEYADCSHNIYAKTPMFYNDYFNMNRHIVLVTAKDLQQCANRAKDSILICLDHPAQPVESSGNDLIILNDSLSDKMIWNILMFIIESFDNWDTQLNEILYRTMSFQELLDATRAIMDDPVALTDQSFKYIAYTSTERVSRFVDSSNQLPLRDVNSLTSQPGFRQLESVRESFVYEAEETAVYKNIFNEGNHVGRLSVLLDAESDQAYCKAILNHLGGYVERLYAKCRSFEVVPMRIAQIHHFLENCLEGGTISIHDFQKALEVNRAQPGDVYTVILFSPNSPDRTVHRISYLGSRIEQMWAGAYCIPYQNHLLLFLNTSQFLRETRKDFYHELVLFLREGLLIAGISREFSRIADIRAYYSQSIFAIEHGGVSNPTFWYHCFDEYALDYLIENGKGVFTPEQICHPGILKLIAHDSANGTSFCQTLFVYMKLQYNAVASAKALYIHRSSFINRMERIQELIPLNLQDMDERIYMLISFRLLGYRMEQHEFLMKQSGQHMEREIPPAT